MRKTLVIAAALLAIALPATTASAARSTLHLTWRSGKYNGYRILLPSNWRYKDASYPSDHGTYLYWDPQNALRKLIVVASGCIGCVETNFNSHRPNPLGELPDYAEKRYWISPWKLAFSGFSDDDPYPVNGLVVVLDQKGHVSGSDIASLWLPQSQHGLATTILNSFQPRA